MYVCKNVRTYVYTGKETFFRFKSTLTYRITNNLAFHIIIDVVNAIKTLSVVRMLISVEKITYLMTRVVAHIRFSLS